MHRVQRAMAQRPSNQTSSDPTPGAMEHSHTKASEQFSSSLKLLMQMLQSSNNDAVMHRHALAGGVTSGAQSVEGGPCGSTGSLSGAFASIPSAKASEEFQVDLSHYQPLKQLPQSYSEPALPVLAFPMNTNNAKSSRIERKPPSQLTPDASISSSSTIKDRQLSASGHMTHNHIPSTSLCMSRMHLQDSHAPQQCDMPDHSPLGSTPANSARPIIPITTATTSIRDEVIRNQQPHPTTTHFSGGAAAALPPPLAVAASNTTARLKAFNSFQKASYAAVEPALREIDTEHGATPMHASALHAISMHAMPMHGQLRRTSSDPEFRSLQPNTSTPHHTTANDTRPHDTTVPMAEVPVATCISADYPAAASAAVPVVPSTSCPGGHPLGHIITHGTVDPTAASAALPVLEVSTSETLRHPPTHPPTPSFASVVPATVAGLVPSPVAYAPSSVPSSSSAGFTAFRPTYTLGFNPAAQAYHALHCRGLVVMNPLHSGPMVQIPRTQRSSSCSAVVSTTNYVPMVFASAPCTANTQIVPHRPSAAPSTSTASAKQPCSSQCSPAPSSASPEASKKVRKARKRPIRQETQTSSSPTRAGKRARSDKSESKRIKAPRTGSTPVDTAATATEKKEPEQPSSNLVNALRCLLPPESSEKLPEHSKVLVPSVPSSPRTESGFKRAKVTVSQPLAELMASPVEKLGKTPVDEVLAAPNHNVVACTAVDAIHAAGPMTPGRMSSTVSRRTSHEGAGGGHTMHASDVVNALHGATAATVSGAMQRPHALSGAKRSRSQCTNHTPGSSRDALECPAIHASAPAESSRLREPSSTFLPRTSQHHQQFPSQTVSQPPGAKGKLLQPHESDTVFPQAWGTQGTSCQGPEGLNGSYPVPIPSITCAHSSTHLSTLGKALGYEANTLDGYVDSSVAPCNVVGATDAFAAPQNVVPGAEESLLSDGICDICDVGHGHAQSHQLPVGSLCKRHKSSHINSNDNLLLAHQTHNCSAPGSGSSMAGQHATSLACVLPVATGTVSTGVPYAAVSTGAPNAALYTGAPNTPVSTGVLPHAAVSTGVVPNAVAALQLAAAPSPPGPPPPPPRPVLPPTSSSIKRKSYGQMLQLLQGRPAQKQPRLSMVHASDLVKVARKSQTQIPVVYEAQELQGYFYVLQVNP